MSGQTTRSKKGRASPRTHDVDPGRSPQRKVEQLEAEVERLRRALHDAKKQIADLERQLAFIWPFDIASEVILI